MEKEFECCSPALGGGEANAGGAATGGPAYCNPGVERGGDAYPPTPPAPPIIWCGGVYGTPLSAATAAARPVPLTPSSGGGVFSRYWIGSGAAGAAGLYGRGAKLAGSFFSSAGVEPALNLWSTGGPLGGGGGKLLVGGGACGTGAAVLVGSDRELRV